MDSGNYPINRCHSVSSESFDITQPGNNSQQGFHDFSGNTIIPDGASGLEKDGLNDDAAVDEEEIVKKKKDSKQSRSRFAFQTRSQVDILDDGYRWRKYGQKAVVNNRFPRSYYRCTHQGCNVKKQVQRQSQDEGVVVTTYEGVHSHAIEKPTDNFDNILSQMHIYSPFLGSTSSHPPPPPNNL